MTHATALQRAMVAGRIARDHLQPGIHAICLQIGREPVYAVLPGPHTDAPFVVTGSLQEACGVWGDWCDERSKYHKKRRTGTAGRVVNQKEQK